MERRSITRPIQDLDPDVFTYDQTSGGICFGDSGGPAFADLPAGKRVPGFVQNLDYLPTFFELAGIPDTENLEGKSLLPCIFGERDGNYDELFLSEATWEVKMA